MLNDLLPVTSALPGQLAILAEPKPAPGVAARAGSASASSGNTGAPRLIEPSQALDRASRAAARAMFERRDVEVTSFFDEGTGRTVYRVADRASGEVLLQSPPDALLRFFASARAAMAKPLVAIEA
jgi:hypothetical protein